MIGVVHEDPESHHCLAIGDDPFKNSMGLQSIGVIRVAGEQLLLPAQPGFKASDTMTITIKQGRIQFKVNDQVIGNTSSYYLRG